MAAEHSVPGPVILRDAASGRWLQFMRLRELVRAGTVGEVAAALVRVEEAVLRDSLYAAGFVAYEAAPAFDDALITHDGGAFPLLVLAPGFVREMPLAFDVRVLERIGPAAQLPRAGLGRGFQS